MFNLRGYEMVHQAGRCCAHGGLIMYIHNELEHTGFFFQKYIFHQLDGNMYVYKLEAVNKVLKNIHFVICKELPARLSRI